jgi:hypothetical protein
LSSSNREYAQHSSNFNHNQLHFLILVSNSSNSICCSSSWETCIFEFIISITSNSSLSTQFRVEQSFAEAINGRELVLSESISVDSKDALFRICLKLGPNYRNLVRHFELECLSEDGLSLLDEHFEIPPELVWQCAIERIAHLPFRFDSRIISNFSEIFAEFRRKRELKIGTSIERD